MSGKLANLLRRMWFFVARSEKDGLDVQLQSQAAEDAERDRTSLETRLRFEQMMRPDRWRPF